MAKSPLGQLYRREATRLRRRYPTLENRELDRIITLSLALAFPTADTAELSQAMAEASLSLNGQSREEAFAYIAEIVGEIVTLAAKACPPSTG